MVETLELKKTKTLVKVVHDYDAESPRGWDNQSNWLCFHNRYDLGDKHINKKFNKDDYDNWDEVEQAIKEEYDVVFITPLSLYDHSVQQIHVGSLRGWDCGRVGFAFITREQARQIIPNIDDYKELNKPMQDKLLSVIQAEVNTYNQWLIGDVHGIQVYNVFEDENGHRIEEMTDSCYGFYFDKDYTMKDAIKEYTCLDESEYKLVEE